MAFYTTQQALVNETGYWGPVWVKEELRTPLGRVVAYQPGVIHAGLSECMVAPVPVPIRAGLQTPAAPCMLMRSLLYGSASTTCGITCKSRTHLLRQTVRMGLS